MRESPPEFLLIDAGNTRVKWATASSKSAICVAGELETSRATAVCVGELARKYPDHRVALACVVPRLLKAFRRAFGTRLLVINAEVATASAADDREVVPPKKSGFRFHYPHPSELGADRITAAVAAHADGVFPAIIIACGTATAFTALDAKGRLCGGAIAPGLQAQLDALLGATAQLPATKLHLPRTALAKSTADAIRAGAILGFRGGVKEIAAELSRALGGKPALYLTGGNAAWVAKDLGPGVKLRPLLVFEGLLIIAARYWPSS
jgi:type III pantothenate kinase